MGMKRNCKTNQKTMIKMAMNTYPPIIALNVNGLNAPSEIIQ